MGHPLNPFSEIPAWRRDREQAALAEARLVERFGAGILKARGGRAMVRPSVVTPGFAFNIVKEAEPNTVFASQDPSEAMVAEYGAEQQYFVHFHRPITTVFPILHTIGVLATVTGRVMTNTSGSDDTNAGQITIALVEDDWDPGSLTWTTKPAYPVTSGLAARDSAVYTGSSTLTATSSAPAAHTANTVNYFREIGTTLTFYGVAFRIYVSNNDGRYDIAGISSLSVHTWRP